MVTATRKKPVQWERKEQKALVSWFYAQYPNEKLAKFNNEGDLTVLQGRRLCEEGLLPGVPDLMVFVPRGGFHGLFIEMKTPEGEGRRKGVVSERQKSIISHLNDRGYLAVVCYGWSEAQKVIKDYMQGAR